VANVLSALKSLRIIPYQSFRGAHNMALDYYLTLYAARNHQPVLRFYGWQPACLSLGRHQSPDVVDHSKLQGIDFVRRPTGGSAIFHVDELTYSFILPLKTMDHHAMYSYFHEVLARALTNLAIPVQLQKTQMMDTYINKGNDTFACFNRSARSEIQYRGRKLVGSAQKIYKHAILQHGSIMLAKTHLKIIDFLNIDPMEKTHQKAILEKNSVSLNEIASNGVCIGDICEALTAGFKTRGIRQIFYKYPTPMEWEKSKSYLKQFRLLPEE